MDIQSKFDTIKQFILQFNSTINLPIPTQSNNNYRNKALFHFNTTIDNTINSYNSIHITNKIIDYSNTINTSNFKVFGIMIKENSTKQYQIKLLIYSHNYRFPLDTQTNIIKFLISNFNIISIYYQITNKIKYSPNKNDPYYHIYGHKTIIDKRYINNTIYQTHLSPDSFSRINLFETNNIYNKLVTLCYKNNNNNLYCIGRDVNFPSQLFNPYFKNTTIITPCHLIYNDLHYNCYQKPTKIYNSDKKSIYKYIDETSNTTIIIAAGRKGIDPSLINKFNQIDNITQIIYISCNTNSMIPDVTKLSLKYRIEKCLVTDEFPNTKYTNILISFIPK